MITFSFEFFYPCILFCLKWIRRKILYVLLISYGINGEVNENEHPRSKIVSAISSYLRFLAANDKEFNRKSIHYLKQDIV
ncbi:putative protein U1 [Almpiwar virus]|uniref:Uncharacterized protein n=1 Tax=Almpiwar virus TaxID=318843 RepID=A0A024A105_9RHAB|nr:putative protein U1 [Almpiwar virus]AHY85662.1 putative protein U1 [Almpiwar virus]